MASDQRMKEERKNLNSEAAEEIENLYHICLTSNMPLEEQFGDVKFVCLGGTPSRMRGFAQLMRTKLGLDSEEPLVDISAGANRYAMYKVGPVLSVSHGMGMPSISILLNELFKLMRLANCKDVVFLRLGTCGGIGLTPGTVVITGKVYDGLERSIYEMAVMGEAVFLPCELDIDLAEDILKLARNNFSYNSIIGKTLCTNDFYEGQGRLDGAFHDYTAEDKMAYLRRLSGMEVTNIEMESLAFAALCQRADIKGAVICVTLLDRLHGDQITTEKQVLSEFQLRPQELAAAFILSRLKRV